MQAQKSGSKQGEHGPEGEAAVAETLAVI